LVLAFSVTSFFIGDRGGGGYPLLAFAWLWHKTIRPLSAWKVIVFVLVIMIVLPLVGSIRTTSGEDRASLAFIREAFFSLENPIVAIIHEMGVSMRTVGYTIELVPSERNYDYGLGYLRATMTLVPSLYWAMTETYSSWLVWTIAPGFARLGGGLGLSFVAEAYANFGWFGTLVFTFILGLLFARLVLWADSSEDVARKALMASFLVFFIAYSRGESAGEIGRLFWAAFVPYLAVKRLRYLRPRARNEPCMHT
jgi:oligosaccharide repeat unit polymerase